MRPTNLLKVVILSCKHCAEQFCFSYFWKLSTATFLVAVLLVLANVQSLADIPSAAHVINFNGSGSDFWIRQVARARDTSAVKKGVEMRTGGSLAVPSENYWASFGFVTQDQKYDGLIVKTYNKGIYTFPCQVEGHFIIAWSGKGGGSRACGAGKDGINIQRSPNKIISQLPKPVEKVASIIGLGNKQNSDKQEDNLIINPAKGQTVIRTSSNISNDYPDSSYYRDFQPDNYDFGCTTENSSKPIQTCRWRCTTKNTPSGNVRECVWNSNFSVSENIDDSYVRKYRCTLRDEPPGSKYPWIATCKWDQVVVENVSVEAFEGDILVKSKENPKGAQVKEGQKFSYPGGKVEPINVGKEANSCEMLKFLNAAYWSSPETPKSISDSIAEQLKQHRQALGVSGRPPTNLSTLEKGVIKEINIMRTNPSAYADYLDAQKQYFYRNWLRLRGETLDPNKRVRAVDEAIAFVRSKQPLPPLSVSVGMSNASRDHVNDQGKSGKNFGHTGNSGNGYWDRLRKHGSVGCNEGESISYFDSSKAEGSVSPARVAVMEALIIDDGLRKAGDRDNFFNPDFQVTGVACGQHGYLRSMCVITYAGGFLEKN
ncbi:MAG: hypothetical protein IGS48_15690 [Oscillatoriales cyanobacterium C42_A2020_001]|nr:hypothetical protein [Leptolyngbyaceae cyanobacterium C42_A2020_001]